MALQGEGSGKGQLPVLTVMSVSPCLWVVPFRLPPWCCSSEGVSLNRWVHVWVPQETLLWAPAASFTNIQSPLIFHSQRLWGLIFLESWAVGTSVGLGVLAPKISLLNFYPRGCGASLRPSYWSGWMWFLQFHCCQTSIQLEFVVVILHSTWFLMFLSDGGSIF